MLLFWMKCYFFGQNVTFLDEILLFLDKMLLFWINVTFLDKMLLFWIKFYFFGYNFTMGQFQIWPIKAMGHDGNMAHFGPMLRKSWRATGQAALPISTPMSLILTYSVSSDSSVHHILRINLAQQNSLSYQDVESL